MIAFKLPSSRLASATSFGVILMLSSFAKRRICFSPLRSLTATLHSRSQRRLAIPFALLLACLNPILHAQTPKHIVSGVATYDLTRDLLKVAPKRFNGSSGKQAAEDFIKAHFAPEVAKGNFEVDSFTASTPVGLQAMQNLIVKFPSTGPAKKDGVIVLASHYETNFPLRDVNFVGANDGACTSALLMEIGFYLRQHPPQGYSIWLLFDDGEEATKDLTFSDPKDFDYGTRHLAARWSNDGTLGHVKAFLLADMIGDQDLNINPDTLSTPWLVDDLRRAAKDTGHERNILQHPQQGVLDDHIPFQQRGVPVLDLLDIDYGPRTAQMPDGFHHTDQDTLSHISPASLQVSADILMDLIHLIDQR